jgi:hypothetical protein
VLLRDEGQVYNQCASGPTVVLWGFLVQFVACGLQACVVQMREKMDHEWSNLVLCLEITVVARS